MGWKEKIINAFNTGTSNMTGNNSALNIVVKAASERGDYKAVTKAGKDALKGATLGYTLSALPFAGSDIIGLKYIPKAQPGMALPTIPSILERAYNKLDYLLTPSKRWEERYGVKPNASLGPLELLNPEAWVGIELETLDKAHRGVELAKEVKTIKEIPELSPKVRFEAIFKRSIKQPVSKSEKGLYSYVKKHHPNDLVNWEKYMDEYIKYWK